VASSNWLLTGRQLGGQIDTSCSCGRPARPVAATGSPGSHCALADPISH